MFNKRLIKALDNIADAIDCLVEKLDTVVRVVNTVGTSVHVDRIVGSDPAVQKALGITPEITFRGTDGRFTKRDPVGIEIDVEKVEKEVEKVNNPEKRRWTDKEIRIVVEGINNGKTHEDIQRSLEMAGFERTDKAVKHRVNEIKRNARRR